VPDEDTRPWRKRHDKKDSLFCLLLLLVVAVADAATFAAGVSVAAAYARFALPVVACKDLEHGLRAF